MLEVAKEASALADVDVEWRPRGDRDIEAIVRVVSTPLRRSWREGFCISFDQFVDITESLSSFDEEARLITYRLLRAREAFEAEARGSR